MTIRRIQIPKHLDYFCISYILRDICGWRWKK